MVTLKHAFDASSMKGLVVKILRGNYPSIPSCYSQNMRELIDEMLEKDPHKRPSIKKVLEKEFLSSRISQLLSQTVAKHEFGKVMSSKVPEEIKEERQSSEKKHRRKEAEPDSKEEKIGYEEVVESMKKCLEQREGEDSEDFAEEPNQRVKATFLTPEGVPLPGVSEQDSAFTRIEALRCYLESMLGLDKFMQAYSYLSVRVM